MIRKILVRFNKYKRPIEGKNNLQDKKYLNEKHTQQGETSCEILRYICHVYLIIYIPEHFSTA